MQRLLAVLLVLIGLIGLVLGRLGETTWAPATETTATVTMSDPGAAVVLDPGVLYVGGEDGEAVIEGASDVSVITAANGDIEAYLEDVRYTRITGASDWTTLSTQEVNPDGAAEIDDPTASDLWRTVDTQPSPYTIDIADFRAGEEGAYRALLIVTDGTEPGADSVSITWPVDAENEWVPFAYAGGAAIAVIGLVLLVVSLGGRRREQYDEVEEPSAAPAAPFLPLGTAGTDTEPAGSGAELEDEDAWSEGTPEGAAADSDEPSEEKGAATAGDADEPTEGSDAEPSAEAEAEAEDRTAPAPDDDRTEQIDAVDDEDPR